MEATAPGVREVLSHFSADVPWMIVLAAALAAYVRMYAVARRRAALSRPPAIRLAAFVAGLAIVAMAVLSPLEHYGNSILWVNFLGFLLLTMIAAPLLLAGAPLTLAFRASGPVGRRRLRRFYRGRLLIVLTFPVVAWLGFAVVTYIWQFTSLTDTAASNSLVRDLQQATLLLVALLFWTPALAVDPMRWRMPYPLRAFYVFVEMTHKGLFGGMFLSMANPFHNGFASNLPAWTGLSPMDDQRTGILILWVGGNVIFIVALGLILAGWLRYERRNAHRTDWRLGLQREERRRRQAALDQVFGRGV